MKTSEVKVFNNNKKIKLQTLREWPNGLSIKLQQLQLLALCIGSSDPCRSANIFPLSSFLPSVPFNMAVLSMSLYNVVIHEIISSPLIRNDVGFVHTNKTVYIRKRHRPRLIRSLNELYGVFKVKK